MSRPLLLIVIELAWFLLVLQSGQSPLGVDVPASVASIALVAGFVAIAVLLAAPRFDRWAWRVEGGIGALIVAVACMTLAGSQADRVAASGLFGVGVVLAVEAIARRWRPDA